MKTRRSLEEILQSTSDVLFPEHLGRKRVEVKSVDCNGDTPLHVMVWRDDRHGVKLLIESGANIDAVGDMGETALHVAIKRKNEAIVALLLQAGANTSIRSEFGVTAKELAESVGGSMARLIRSPRDVQ